MMSRTPREVDGIDDLIDAAGSDPEGAGSPSVGIEATQFYPTGSAEEDGDGTVSLDYDGTKLPPLSATVNTLNCSFAFARPIIPFDDIVIGVQGLLEGAAAASSPTQRALAADVSTHLLRLRQAAAMPRPSLSYQGQAHLAAQIRSMASQSFRPGADRRSVAGPTADDRAAVETGAAGCSSESTAAAGCVTADGLSVGAAGADRAAMRTSSARSSGDAPASARRITLDSASDGGPAAAPRQPGKSSSLTTKAVRLNHRVIKLRPFKKDFDGLLADVRSFWTEGCPELGTVPLCELVAGSEKRAALKERQVFGTSDSCKLSKFKKLAEEAAFLGGWDKFDDRMREERDRWDARERDQSAPRPRAFRWAEIVAFVNMQARERRAT